ncbi:hypothetical protein [Nannocystis pusilla]|uniref:hypothetical protein n=1 Tax=Nannocystis pusilla TaxID=889268 RepID=UPI003DA4C414
MTKKQQGGSPMTKSDAARIQSQSDRTGHNQDFARRAQSTADRRAQAEHPAPQPPKKHAQR